MANARKTTLMWTISSLLVLTALPVPNLSDNIKSILINTTIAAETSQPGCTSPPSGLISWWPLDETSGNTAEDIVNGNDGIYVDTPIPATGKVEGALSFDGVDDYVFIGNPPVLDFGTSSFTIAAWAKTNPTGTYTDVFGNAWANAAAVELRKTPTGEAEFVSGTGPGQLSIVTGTTLINDGAWHFLVGVRDNQSDSLYIYVNGFLEGVIEDISGSLIPTDIYQIGARNRDFLWAGLIDEVQIFNRALTPTEILAGFNAGSAGNCKGPNDEIPTLSEWGMIIFSLLLFGWMAWVVAKRRQNITVGL